MSPISRLARSAGALLAGFALVVALSIGTDVLMRALGIFPSLAENMQSSALLALAFAYRSVYGVLGAYVVARLAPYAPMGHALVSGVAGFVVGTVGAVAMWNVGPNWYPVALAVTAIPFSWLGGALSARAHAS